MAKALRCPLAGDRLYGGGEDAHSLRARLGGPRVAPVRRVMLHAAELSLPHPLTGEEIQLRCAPPADFQRLASNIVRESRIRVETER